MTVAQYIIALPKKQKEIMTLLRSWILDVGTQVTEQMNNDGPSFHLNGALCYLTHDEDSVSICFNRGYELPKQFPLLESEGRKHVMSITFYGVTELDEHEDEVKEVLNEAAILNGYLVKRKK